MRTIIAVLLLLISTSLSAYKPDCDLAPEIPACSNNSPDLAGVRQFSTPDAGTLVLLLGAGLAGLLVARRR